MGLFSYVKLEMKCPYCGALINDFQSKDGELMEVNEPWTLNRFYSSCKKCDKWIEYIRKGTELSEIDLINEGKEAVDLLRRFNELKRMDIAALKLGDEIENFLKKTNYPADNTNWIDWYELKKDDN